MYEYKRLIDNTIVSDTAGAVYTHTGANAYVQELIFHNFSTSAATITLWDGVNTDVNKIYKISLAAGKTWEWEIKGAGLVKSGVETVYAQCSEANAVSIRAFGGQD